MKACPRLSDLTADLDYPLFPLLNHTTGVPKSAIFERKAQK